MNTRSVINTAFTSYPATGVQLPNGRQLANTYDALYRRTLVQDVTNSVNVAAWQFFGPSRVAEVTLGNGLVCSWMDNARTHSAVQPSVANPAWGDQSSDRLGYDGAGRPITKRYLAGGINGSTHAYNNPSSVVGFTTEYDLASNKFYERHLHAEERSHLYEPFSNGAPTGGYDSLNRLRQYQRGTLTGTDGFAAAGGGSVSTPITLPNTDTKRTYDLDSLGNWRRTVFTPEGGTQETEVRQHNGLNEITRIQNGASQTNLTYDGAPGHSNGNLKNDGTRSYTWDALNRLVQVNRVSDGAVIGQYVYDALNRRIRKTVSNGGLSGTIPNGTTDCIYSGWRCVEERNPFGGEGSTDTPTAQYIWGIYLDECLQQRLLVALNNFAANSDLYPLQDLLYRTTGLADSSGTVREAYDTDAYGNTLIFRNSGSPPSAIAFSDSDTQVSDPTCPFIFTGRQFDPEIALYFYRARYLNESLGRLTSRDFIVVFPMFSWYCYVRDNPAVRVDPSGNTDYWCARIDDWPGYLACQFCASQNPICLMYYACVTAGSAGQPEAIPAGVWACRALYGLCQAVSYAISKACDEKYTTHLYFRQIITPKNATRIGDVIQTFFQQSTDGSWERGGGQLRYGARYQTSDGDVFWKCSLDYTAEDFPQTVSYEPIKSYVALRSDQVILPALAWPGGHCPVDVVPPPPSPPKDSLPNAASMQWGSFISSGGLLGPPD